MIDRLLAVDPSIRAMGWAAFRFEQFEYGGLCRSKLPFPDAVLDQCKQLPSVEVRDLVIEIPQVYDPRQWRGDPNDLIKLAYMSGAVFGTYRDINLTLVKPYEWKGQTPKDVIEYRVQQELSLGEMDIVVNCMKEYPKHLQHNIWESIGIGLFALRRLHV